MIEAKSLDDDFALAGRAWEAMYMDFAVYLVKRGSEVLSMLFEEFKIEDYGDVRYQDGLGDGLLQKAIEAAKKLLGLGVPAETVAEGVGLPLTKVKKLAGD